MEPITQETIDKAINSFGQVSIQFEKLGNIMSDLNNCKSDYSKAILLNAASKIAEQIGIKEKVFG